MPGKKSRASRIPQPVIRSGANRRYVNSNGGGPKLPLLPSGVNNKATMPQNLNVTRFRGCEVMDIRTVVASDPGETIYDTLITPDVVRRLGILSKGYQRIKWHAAKVKIVPLNGSTVQAGYTAGVLEDPEMAVPATGKSRIAFLTALRGAEVRQAWVQAEVGLQVPDNQKPRMYTQPGSDVRRYSPGRFIMVAGGVIENGTFQLQLEYDVELSVPVGAISVDAEEGTFNTSNTNNAAVSTNAINLPQTGGVSIPSGSTITLTSDIVTSFILTDAQSVGHFGIIRAGTRVTFTQSGGYWTMSWATKPEGQTAYVVRINTVNNISTMSVVGAGNFSFITWVNTSQA